MADIDWYKNKDQYLLYHDIEVVEAQVKLRDCRKELISIDLVASNVEALPFNLEIV